MSITTVKVLRTISKIVLLVVGIGIIGYGGLMIYKSVINKPQRVRITNVTDSAATITWVTDNPVRGVVYYKDEGSFLPGPLGFLGSKVAYDDRDFARAQDECVKAFNENAKKTKDEDFAVDGNNFDCENIPVEKLGAYYTHSVTIKNLNESSTYFFVVGNGIWSWNVDGVDKEISENDLPIANSFNFKTSRLLEEVPTPNIAYGTVYAGEYVDGEALVESESKDSLVFAYLTVNGINSQIISAVTNSDGGWTFDKSNFRDTEGNLITDLSEVSMMVCAQYENVNPKSCAKVTENLNNDTVVDLQGNLVEDLETYKKDIFLKKFDELLNKIYAMSSDGHDMSKCTDSGVSGCAPSTAKCIKKCPVTGTTLFDWVDVGTVANGDCNLPSYCGGCTAADNARGCIDGTSGDNHSKMCLPSSGTYFWKDWNNSDSCIDSGSGETNCKTNGECQNVYNGARKVCVNYNWVTEQGSCGSSGGRTVPESCTDGNGATIKAGKPCPQTGGTCNGTTWKCEKDTVEGEKKLNQETCKIIPTYTGSYFADIGANAGKEYQTLNSCKACEVSIGAYRCTQHYGVPNIRYVDSKDETSYTLNITELNKIKLLSSQPDNGVEMVNNNPTLKTSLENELREIYKKGEKTENVGSDNIVIGIGLGYQKKVTTYCNALGLPLIPASGGGKLCKLDGNAENLIKVPALILGAYAQDSASSGYTLYLPEYGMYSFELGDYQLTTDTTNGNTYYIFYIETNDKKGFQMPVDPDNPTEKEDIMLKSSSVSITYKKVSSAQSYTLVKGINLVSFNFIPVSTDLGPLTAKGVIEEAAKKDVTIQYISSFDGGRWAKGYTCKDNKCSGNDFNIIPGKGYLVYVTEGGDISIGGYTLKSSVPVNLSGGWNLVGIHGYTNAYTARTLIDSMNKIDGITANNVTWWPTSKGMYEGLQVTEEQQYGFDFPISPTNGYFVRISSFQPEDSKCKSLLWNEGGTLNGACGVTK